MITIAACWCRCDQRFVIQEDGLIVQIEIIVTDFLPGHAAFSKAVIERGIQMIIGAINPDNVPGMAVFDAFFRIIAANRDHAPDSKRIAKNLYCFGNPFTNTHALPQRTNDLVGIGLL